MRVPDVRSRHTRAEAWAYDRSTVPALTVWVRENVLESFFEEVPESGTVPDVGCGGGQVARAIEEMRQDLTVLGLDLSRDVICWARDRANQQERSRSYLRGAALELPFRSDDFDAVLSVGSLKHWPDCEAEIREYVWVLKPEGLLALLEAGRDTTWTETWAFAGQLSVPVFARPLFFPCLKTVFAGKSPTGSEARRIVSNLEMDRPKVGSIEDIPLIPVNGRD